MIRHSYQVSVILWICGWYAKWRLRNKPSLINGKDIGHGNLVHVPSLLPPINNPTLDQVEVKLQRLQGIQAGLINSLGLTLNKPRSSRVNVKVSGLGIICTSVIIILCILLLSTRKWNRKNFYYSYSSAVHMQLDKTYQYHLVTNVLKEIKAG